MYKKIKLKSTGLELPSVIFGTSGLGNLFTALSDDQKLCIVKECIEQSNGPVVFDSAGKYGAGLALESLGKCLKTLNVDPQKVIISNKLGWLRTSLKTPEPTFEPGVWKELKHDAVQKIGYDEILECFEQGNTLLGGYVPSLVSVHDPDEYLANAETEADRQRLYDNILSAYRALSDLKLTGKVKGIGVGAKDWKIIERIANDVQLDWVMIANSMTIKHHPQDLLNFIKSLNNKGVTVINSAVFHSGFLTGGDYYDYKLTSNKSSTFDDLFKWRTLFFNICHEFNIKPATACVQFALNVPGIKSVALNTTNPKRVSENLAMAGFELPDEFWQRMISTGLISKII